MQDIHGTVAAAASSVEARRPQKSRSAAENLAKEGARRGFLGRLGCPRAAQPASLLFISQDLLLRLRSCHTRHNFHISDPNTAIFLSGANPRFCPLIRD